MSGAFFWIAISVTVIIIWGGPLLYFYKVKQKKLETLTKLAETTGNISPDTLQMLALDEQDYRQDYRSSLIWLAVGIPLTIGIGIEDPSAAIFGLIPVFVGIAYAISGKLRLRESSD